jgi:hypothetical protein
MLLLVLFACLLMLVGRLSECCRLVSFLFRLLSKRETALQCNLESEVSE